MRFGGLWKWMRSGVEVEGEWKNGVWIIRGEMGSSRLGKGECVCNVLCMK